MREFVRSKYSARKRLAKFTYVACLIRHALSINDIPPMPCVLRRTEMAKRRRCYLVLTCVFTVFLFGKWFLARAAAAGDCYASYLSNCDCVSMPPGGCDACNLTGCIPSLGCDCTLESVKEKNHVTAIYHVNPGKDIQSVSQVECRYVRPCAYACSITGLCRNGGAVVIWTCSDYTLGADCY